MRGVRVVIEMETMKWRMIMGVRRGDWKVMMMGSNKRRKPDGYQIVNDSRTRKKTLVIVTNKRITRINLSPSIKRKKNKRTTRVSCFACRLLLLRLSSSLSPIKMNQQVKNENTTKKSKKMMRLKLACVVYERVSNGIVVEDTDQENQQVVLLDRVVLHPQEDTLMMTTRMAVVEEEVTAPPLQEDSVVPHVKSSVIDIPRPLHNLSSVLIRKNSHVKIIVVRPLLKIDVMVVQCC